ncbi:MAG: serine/threonine-protein phosphatase [Candidatus Riflebacteria bacterium]|nr:serine/threonine-protein phosphatase [Candidatus Riflebacteria bacterium]
MESSVPESASSTQIYSLVAIIFDSLFIGFLSYQWLNLQSRRVTHSDVIKMSNEDSVYIEPFFQPRSILNETDFNINRLQALHSNLERITQLFSCINFTLALTRQLKVALSLAHEIFPRHTFLIFLNRNERLKFQIGTTQIASGTILQIEENNPFVLRSIETLKMLVDIDRLQQSDWKSLVFPMNAKVSSPDLTIIPLMLWNRISGVTVLVNPEMKPLSSEEIILASLISRHMAIIIENHDLCSESSRQERLNHEVGIARQIQVDSLPHEASSLKGFDIFGQCIPCDEISGDYYDFIPLPDNRLLITIANVSGKGLPAALFLSKLQILVRGLAGNYRSPAEFMTYLSCQMSNAGMGSLFATMLMVIIEAGSTTVSCSSAGHCRPLIVRAGGGFVEEAGFEAGIPLGLFEISEGGYVNQAIDLMPGDGIFLYTDGLTDMVSNRHNRERYGIERLRSAMEKVTAGKASVLVREIVDGMNIFRGKTPLEDDVTMVYIKAEKRSS